MLEIFASLLFLFALAVLWLSRRQRKSSGIPDGKVLYNDAGHWNKVEKPLYDVETRLTGKPDYLIEENGRLIPVEVKSSRAPNLPHDSHIYQLAAYCLLVERTFAKRPPYGILRYRDKTFRVDYTQELEQELVSLLDTIHSQGKKGAAERSHQDPARCARCGFRDFCDQRL